MQKLKHWFMAHLKFEPIHSLLIHWSTDPDEDRLALLKLWRRVYFSISHSTSKISFFFFSYAVSEMSGNVNYSYSSKMSHVWFRRQWQKKKKRKETHKKLKVSWLLFLHCMAKASRFSTSQDRHWFLLIEAGVENTWVTV